MPSRLAILHFKGFLLQHYAVADLTERRLVTLRKSKTEGEGKRHSERHSLGEDYGHAVEVLACLPDGKL